MTTYGDLVKRYRNAAEKGDHWLVRKLAKEMAAAIEALEKERDEAKEQLRKFAEPWDWTRTKPPLPYPPDVEK